MVGVIVGHGQGGIAVPPVQLNGIHRRIGVQHLAVQRPPEPLMALHGIVRRRGNSQSRRRPVALIAQQRPRRRPVMVGAVVQLLIPTRRRKGLPQVHQPVVVHGGAHFGKYRILVKQHGIPGQLILQDVPGRRHRQKGQVIRLQSQRHAPVKKLPYRPQIPLEPCLVQVVLGHPADILIPQQHLHPAAQGRPAVTQPELVA